MAAPKSEKYVNLASTTLASAYTAADGHIHVTSATGFPADGNFHLCLGDEADATKTLFKVTAISGTEFTGTAEGTDSSIDSGKAVVQVLTAGALDAMRTDNCYSDTLANRIAAEKAGRLFLPSDSYYLQRDSGSAWASFGPIYPLTPPVPGDFAWVNQGTATLTTTNGGMVIYAPATGGRNFRILKKAVPSAPYTVTAVIRSLIAPGGSYGVCGLCLRQSSDGKFVIFFTCKTTGTSQVGYSQCNRVTEISDVLVNNAVVASPFFLRIKDDNTNRILQYSEDGITFVTFRSQSRTDYITPDEIGFFAEGFSVDNYGTLLSWKEE